MPAVSGALNEKQGGPSIIVPIDKTLVSALYKPSQWAVTKDPSEHNRRSIYLIAKRNLRLPFMEVFDAPDTLVSCPRRESSTHAPQALELLNGDLANQQAEALANGVVGRTSLPVMFAALSAGGHLRVGMEDTVSFARGRPVTGNAELVERAAALAELAQRPPMRPDQARALLGVNGRR